ncbi:hypothetical protein SNE40_008079 [Patella caerulea]|uniref:Ankyrin repeat domain-containing protein 60 n=1 Tax=Patella caerulea TaxID=87958 RepID=A0AAN8PUM0_PATCE
MAGRNKSKAQLARKERSGFTIYAKLIHTDEKFALKNICGEMKISELKGQIEFVTGLPVHLQRVYYLDEGDLVDGSDIKSNDIVAGSKLQLSVWSQWRELVEAVVSGEADWVFRLGVTYPTDYQTPNSQYMAVRARKAWIEERAFVALCIAANRGHDELVRKLIDAGANVDSTTPLGRTALHLAASRGRGHIIDLLLEKGAQIDAEDDSGQSALSIADKFGNKSCERHLFLFRWQQRAKKAAAPRKVPRMAHQYNDSKFPVWKDGRQAQMYLSNILPPGEFEGTALSAPPRRTHPSLSRKQKRDEEIRVLQEMIEKQEAAKLESSSDGRLPAIQETSPKREMSAEALDIEMRKAKLPKQFDEWLNKKTEKEKEKLNVKRKQREIKKMEEEERKKEEFEKGQSYETWLSQREDEKRKAALSAGSKHTAEGRIIRSNSQGALRVYLQSLGKSKSGFSYYDWLLEKEADLYSSESSGKMELPFLKT